MDAIFTVALVKGAVEGDHEKHFAALGGINHHLADAVRADLVTWDGAATPAGVAFYERHRLAGLPPGRAYLWPYTPELLGALAELAGRDGDTTHA